MDDAIQYAINHMARLSDHLIIQEYIDILGMENAVVSKIFCEQIGVLYYIVKSSNDIFVSIMRDTKVNRNADNIVYHGKVIHVKTYVTSC